VLFHKISPFIIISFHLLNFNSQDDHDYGKNNMGKEYVNKKPSQEMFLDFIDEPAESVRRQREGVLLASSTIDLILIFQLYASYAFGPASKRVHIILLDVRYFREHADLDKTGDAEPDILGEASSPPIIS